MKGFDAEFKQRLSRSVFPTTQLLINSSLRHSSKPIARCVSTWATSYFCPLLLDRSRTALTLMPLACSQLLEIACSIP